MVAPTERPGEVCLQWKCENEPYLICAPREQYYYLPKTKQLASFISLTQVNKKDTFPYTVIESDAPDVANAQMLDAACEFEKQREEATESEAIAY